MDGEFTRTQVPYCQIGWDWIIDFSQCLHEWQSLLAGVLALFAALGTVITIRCQMRQTEKIEKERILRQRNAVRMAFPFHLSAIMNYLNKLADYFISTFIWEEDEGLPLEAVKQAYRELFPPAWSDNIQAELSRLAEALTDVRHVKHLAEITSNIQIINSKITNTSTNINMTREDVLEMIINCGRSALLVESLYNYMRFVDDKFPTFLSDDTRESAWKKILGRCYDFVTTKQNALKFQALFKTAIDNKIANGCSPWLEKSN